MGRSIVCRQAGPSWERRVTASVGPTVGELTLTVGAPLAEIEVILLNGQAAASVDLSPIEEAISTLQTLVGLQGLDVVNLAAVVGQVRDWLKADDGSTLPAGYYDTLTGSIYGQVNAILTAQSAGGA